MKLTKNELMVLFEGLDLLWNSDSYAFTEHGVEYKELYKKLFDEIKELE